MTTGKVALVTGAGSGIGRATAVALAEAGLDLVLVGRTPRKLEETAREVEVAAPGRRVVIEPADLTEALACRAVVQRIDQHLGRLDALANVAGNAPLLPIEHVTPEIWRQCIEANLGSVVQFTAAAWPIFRRQNGGVIVNISSLASVDPFPHFAIYAAAKVGLNMFTRCTAREGEAIGLRAVTIAPGAVETPMLRAIFDERTVPPDAAMTPAQVATVIRDCITGVRKFESGETILLENKAEKQENSKTGNRTGSTPV